MTDHDDILTPERLADMRARVMADIQRPSRWKPALIGVAAAVGTMVVLGSVGLGLTTGAARMGADDRVDASATVSSEFDDQMRQSADGFTPTALGRTAADADMAADTETASAPDHEIVTGWTSLTVARPRAAASDIRTEVTRLRGRIDAESRDTGSVTLTVRVPSADVSAFTEFLDGLGDVTESSTNRQQVGQQVADLDARIEALQVSTARLSDIMRKATNTADLLAAETQLSQRQAELEGLTAQRRALGDQTSLASITVQITARSAATAVDPGGFRGGLVNGWNALVETFNSLLSGVGFVLPWLVPLALAAWLVRLLWRRLTR